jgi:hypothetical protein
LFLAAAGGADLTSAHGSEFFSRPDAL